MAATGEGVEMALETAGTEAGIKRVSEMGLKRYLNFWNGGKKGMGNGGKKSIQNAGKKSIQNAGKKGIGNGDKKGIWNGENICVKNRDICHFSHPYCTAGHKTGFEVLAFDLDLALLL